MNTIGKQFYQLIQSLFWDPVYLPWESEAFRNAVAPATITKRTSEYLQFSGSRTRSNKED
ncbi:hypothetical protein ABWW58_09525 [Sporolactobacillus sp. STCC-11]|uniref:hypothetical protein n=1 Tax=Sporolactobacillus caesalpiniae TaxID=3230362 RepID=UPI0033909CBF